MEVHEDIEVSFIVNDQSKVADNIRKLYDDNPEVLNEINFQLGALVKLAVQSETALKVFMDLDKDLIRNVLSTAIKKTMKENENE